jgi:hypothetical protein
MRPAILALLLLSGCGRSGHDPAFAPYVARFVAEATARGAALDSSVSITFEDGTDEGVGAQCKSEMGSHWIVVNPRAWGEYNDASREQTIFHEMGHCVLGRGHTAEGEPSLMAPQLPAQTSYGLFRTAYIDELFEGAK